MIGEVTGVGGAAAGEAALQQMLKQAGLEPPASAADAVVQVLSDSPSSVEFELTLQDGTVAHTSFRIEPGKSYMPSAAERAAAQKAGRRVYAVKFEATSAESGPNHATLEYFIPYDSLPEDVRRAVLGAPAVRLHFPLVSDAYAQVAGDLGMGMYGGYDTAGGWSGPIKAMKNVQSALEMSADHDQWMQQLDALEGCARNPTSTVTQNAYRQDPQYQQRTIDAIQQARSEVQQTTAVRFLNTEVSVAKGLVSVPSDVPGSQQLKSGLKGGKSMLGELSKSNDSALKGIAEQQIADISKLVDCDLGRPQKIAHGDGMFEYHMHRKGFHEYDEEDRLVKGTFDLSPGPGGAAMLHGDGEFKGRMTSKTFGTSAECEGTSEVQGSIYAGRMKIDGGPNGGNCLFHDRGKTTVLSPRDSDTAFTCEFQDVDLVNGGSYSVHANGDESEYAICKVDLGPQKK